MGHLSKVRYKKPGCYLLENNQAFVSSGLDRKADQLAAEVQRHFRAHRQKRRRQDVGSVGRRQRPHPRARQHQRRRGQRRSQEVGADAGRGFAEGKDLRHLECETRYFNI